MATSNAVRVQTARREKVIVNSFTIMVPSVTINQVTPTGTIPLLYTLACKGGKNQKPRFYANNADLHRQWTLKTGPTPPSPPNRPVLPVCGDPAAVGAVGRTETAANLRKI